MEQRVTGDFGFAARILARLGRSRSNDSVLKMIHQVLGEVNHRNATDADTSLIAQLFGHREFALHLFPNEQRFDYAGLAGRLLSSSYAPLAGHPNYEPMLARLREIFAEYNEEGFVNVLYQTQVFVGTLIFR